MNTYFHNGIEWLVVLQNSKDTLKTRKLLWYEWFELRYLQLRDWFHLLGKEK